MQSQNEDFARSGRPFRLREWLVEPKLNRISRGDETSQVPLKDMEVLVFLAAHAGNLVSKRQIIDSVWEKEYITENTLAQAISDLRGVFGDEPRDPRYIETITKRGYRLIAPMEVIQDNGLEAESLPHTAESSGGSPHEVSAGKRSRRYRTAVVSGLFLVLATFAAFWGGMRIKSLSSPGDRLDSIGVLPFSTETPFEEGETLCRALTAGITNGLSRLFGSGVRVIAWSTMAEYEDKNIDLQTVADELDVGSFLIGMVDRSGEQLSISVEIVDATNQRQLWGKLYNRPVSDVLVVQEAVAVDAAGVLRPRLTPAEQAWLHRRHTKDPTAYALYQKGRFCWNRREPEGFACAIQFFEKARMADPDFALAYAGLADCLALLGAAEYGVIPPSEARERAVVAASTALAIDEGLAEPHATLGLIGWTFDGDWERAEREFQRAIEINPGYATAHQWYAEYLAAMGRLDEAAAEIELAHSLDPRSLVIGADTGLISYYRRDCGEAISRFQQVIEMDPSFLQGRLGLALTFVQCGRARDAIDLLEPTAEVSGRAPVVLAVLAHSYGRAGDRDVARQILDELVALSRDRYIPAYYIAGVHIGLGNTDQAFEWLALACDEPSGPIASIMVEPALDDLRNDPRFDQLLRRLKLAS